MPSISYLHIKLYQSKKRLSIGISTHFNNFERGRFTDILLYETRRNKVGTFFSSPQNQKAPQNFWLEKKF
jgi:hypothetical protein